MTMTGLWMLLCVPAFAAALSAKASNSSTPTFVANSRIMVHIPFHLHDPNGFPHVPAEFGLVSSLTEGSISTYMYYVESNLCEPLQFTKQ
jgi:hypothetical protein